MPSSPPAADGPALHPVARLPEHWRAVLTGRGEPGFRAEQVFRWIHARAEMDPDRMTNLPKALRRELLAEGLVAPCQVVEEHQASDGVRKLLIRLHDEATIESVLLPAAGSADDDTRGEDDDAPSPEPEEHVRVTQCISTQVGCAMGCAMCASGEHGLGRHLGAEEIVAQVLVARQQLRPGEALRSVVFMGMGEPLHNLEGTLHALRLLTHPEGLAIAPRRITVSTCGLVPGIDRLGEEFDGQIGLALSLHGADDPTRQALAPIGRRYPIKAVLAALQRYTRRARRLVTVEYTLVDGRNDREQDAQALARLLRWMRVKVNLIPMNPVDHSPLGPPPTARVAAFQQVLVAAGVLCFQRRSRGGPVAGACGQLAARHQGSGRRAPDPEPDLGLS